MSYVKNNYKNMCGNKIEYQKGKIIKSIYLHNKWNKETKDTKVLFHKYTEKDLDYKKAI